MKKEKGFTLIELLAVILILGIIALIAIPTVTKIIKESKRGAFKSSVQNLISAAETKCQVEQMKGEELTTTYTFTNGSVDKELNIKGDLPKEGTITVDSSCNVTVDVTDGTFTATKSLNSDELILKEVGKVAESKYTCVRATTLHTEECTQTDERDFCSAVGYTATGSKGTTITYGQIGTKGSLATGDAFDCDVNGDGVYDSQTERFYYVSDYYNTTTKEFESDKATLIYYNNTTKGIADNTSDSFIEYNSNIEEGPITAITNLPTKTQWTNIVLQNEKRAILTDIGLNKLIFTEFEDPDYYMEYNFPKDFDYSLYATRILIRQELEKNCVKNSYGDIDAEKCNFLFENTKFSSDSIDSHGYWLENPYGGIEGFVSRIEVKSDFCFSYLSQFDASDRESVGTRPVIELLKSKIDY